MKTLTVQIVLQSPTLLAAAPPASNLTETLLFVPGNTVRGLLAYRSLDQGRNPSDNVFQRLFVQGEARFGCACINGALPIPLSARSCKYDPGFTKDSGGHGMIDLLLAGNEEKRCTYVFQRHLCGQAVDYAQGFYDPHGFCKVSVKTRLITRTAIDPTRGAARTGQLYSQRVLAEEQTFTPQSRSQTNCTLPCKPYSIRRFPLVWEPEAVADKGGPRSAKEPMSTWTGGRRQTVFSDFVPPKRDSPSWQSPSSRIVSSMMTTCATPQRHLLMI